jgi:hypothetical protein
MRPRFCCGLATRHHVGARFLFIEERPVGLKACFCTRCHLAFVGATWANHRAVGDESNSAGLLGPRCLGRYASPCAGVRSRAAEWDEVNMSVFGHDRSVRRRRRLLGPTPGQLP